MALQATFTTFQAGSETESSILRKIRLHGPKVQKSETVTFLQLGPDDTQFHLWFLERTQQDPFATTNQCRVTLSDLRDFGELAKAQDRKDLQECLDRFFEAFDRVVYKKAQSFVQTWEPSFFHGFFGSSDSE